MRATYRKLNKYTRLPFGIKTAPTIFRQIMDTMIFALSVTAASLDGIIFACRRHQGPQERGIAFLQLIQEYGFRLRAGKFTFFVPWIKYLPCIADENSRDPNSEKLRAVTETPLRTDITTLCSSLDLVNYCSIFLPTLHNIQAPVSE